LKFCAPYGVEIKPGSTTKLKSSNVTCQKLQGCQIFATALDQPKPVVGWFYLFGVQKKASVGRFLI